MCNVIQLYFENNSFTDMIVNFEFKPICAFFILFKCINRINKLKSSSTNKSHNIKYISSVHDYLAK
jgi:hypothetical protein